MEEWDLIIEALVLNKVEEYITEQIKEKYGNNVNIRFQNVKQTNKRQSSKKFDRTQYRIECEKNWRK